MSQCHCFFTITFFTHCCLDDVTQTEEATAPEIPVPETDTAPDVKGETDADEVKRGNILLVHLAWFIFKKRLGLSRGCRCLVENWLCFYRSNFETAYLDKTIPKK